MRRMRPAAQSLICGEQWSRTASQRFASLISDCALMVKVFSVVHGVLHVDVFRYLGAVDIVNIRDILIEERYAELAEDSYESKVCASPLMLHWGIRGPKSVVNQINLFNKWDLLSQQLW